MNKWMLQLMPQLLSEIKQQQFDFVNYKNFNKINKPNTAQLNLLFKLFVLGRWKTVFE